MNIAQFLLAIVYYLVFSLFVLIGLPLLRRLIPHKTLAYVASKPAGLILFGYGIWLLSSFHILDYQWRWFILALYVIAVLVGLYYSRSFFSSPALAAETKKNKKNTPSPRSFYKKILLIEGVTLLVYLVYLYIRSYNPAINGTERFMDMMLLTSAGKTHYFPFADAWYAGKTINYYYYGSYLMSLISNLTHIPYALTYTFSLGLLYCESSLLAATLVFSLTRSKFFAVLAAFLVTTAGTAFYAGCTIHDALLPVPQTCSYASSTRLYTPSYIINEIPSYSFTVGDLHAHLLALPFFIFDLILFYLLATTERPDWKLWFITGLALATSGMINLWDVVTAASLLGVLALIKAFLARGQPKVAARWLISAAGTIIFTIILMLPDILRFQSPVAGIGFDPSYVALHHLTNVQYPTPLLAELGMWGIFLAGVIWFFVAKRKQWRDYLYLLVLSIVAVGIIIGVELFFIKDIYSVANPPYFRANTTFKFGYHAWTLLCVTFSVAMWALWRRLPNQKRSINSSAAAVLVVLAVGAGLFYPYQAVEQFYLSTGTHGNLDGSQWMATAAPGDLATINYINQNFHDRYLIAEAVGDSYTTYSRITTYTGMITPMGWKTHEWTWRFDAKAAEKAKPGQTVETGWGPISLVAQDIQMLYETPSAAVAQQIISKYKIQYVYIGGLEHTAYPGLQEQKFYQLGTVIFSADGSELLKVQ